MEKGKFGIRLAFYAVAAFVLAIIGNFTALLLVAGVAILVEKDEWASRQTIQALCLYAFPYLVSVVFHVLGFVDWLSWSSNSLIYAVYRGWSRFESVVDYAADIVVYVFAIIAIVKVAKGKEAGIPLADKFANWVYGKVAAKPVYVQQPVQQPVQPAQPVQQTAPAADVCKNCGAPLNGAAFCTKCGTPANK